MKAQKIYEDRKPEGTQCFSLVFIYNKLARGSVTAFVIINRFTNRDSICYFRLFFIAHKLQWKGKQNGAAKDITDGDKKHAPSNQGKADTV